MHNYFTWTCYRRKKSWGSDNYCTVWWELHSTLNNVSLVTYPKCVLGKYNIVISVLRRYDFLSLSDPFWSLFCWNTIIQECYLHTTLSIFFSFCLIRHQRSCQPDLYTVTMFKLQTDRQLFGTAHAVLKLDVLTTICPFSTFVCAYLYWQLLEMMLKCYPTQSD